MDPNSQPDIRRVIRYFDEVRREGRQSLSSPVFYVVAAVVVRNPCAGRYVDDLAPLRDSHSAFLGGLLGSEITRIVEQVAPGSSVEAYGKGVIVGVNGEVEHGSVIIHTGQFTRYLKERWGGVTPMPSAEKRGSVGSAIQLAIKSGRDLAIRSHHQTYEFAIPDAPLPDEIVVFLGAATGGRPLARSLNE